MIFAVEAWTVNGADEEESAPTEMVECQEFAGELDARDWAWEKMEEGFFVRMFRR